MNVYDALGLTSGEKRVYQALVKLRSSTTGPLYKHAGVSQSKVYEILSRLQQKGLAASIKKQGRRYWHPANPTLYLDRVERELEELEERRNVLEKELPHLLKDETYPPDEAQVLLGYNGFQAALWSFLDTYKKGETFSVFGSPEPIPKPFVTFLQAYNRERAKRGIHGRFLYGSKLKTFAKNLYSMPKSKVKFIQGLTPSTIAIGKDRIIIMTWDDGGKFVVIMGKQIAESYARFFQSMWGMAGA